MTLANGHVTVPSNHRTGFRVPRHAGTALAAAAVVSASVLAFVVIDSDTTSAPDAVTTEMVDTLAENGSISAIDHRVETRAAVGPDANSPTAGSRPSISAIDHADANR